eukprot:PhF_6_TR26570/c0_g1_i1/m.38445/K00799/GST, gst; glutathione S-transferase
MPLKLYYDPLSQPSRAVKWFLTVNKIPHEDVLVGIMKGEQNAPEYLAKNPMGMVPIIEEDGQFLSESAAILLYLSNKYAPATLPQDPFQVGRITEALMLNDASARLVTLQILRPVLVLKRTNPTATKEELGQAMAKGFTEFFSNYTIQVLETKLGKQQYIAGTPEYSIADLQYICEFNQIPVFGGPLAATLDKFPNIKAWMERMKAVPGHDDFLVPLQKALAVMMAPPPSS